MRRTAAVAWGGVLSARAALLGGMTLGFYAALLIDQTQPSELPTRIAAAFISGTVIAGVSYTAILTATERAGLTVALRVAIRRVLRPR